MKVSEMIEILSKAPENAEVICGESPFTMWVISDHGKTTYFDMMFVGIKGSEPILTEINKPIILDENW